MFKIERLDHFVIPCRDVEATCAFYVRVLNMRRIDFGDGRVALGFGRQKINLQPAGWVFGLRAKNHFEGTADFCLITQTPLEQVMAHLDSEDVQLEVRPSERSGALGPIQSVYFRDHDGNLVEVSNYPDEVESA
ncbi:MAG: VOC family protein [Alphaproteobacteria bacterium]|jgi:catechol 2,3-dioxygenase-like lactoylglutathione lyase family enzyme